MPPMSMSSEISSKEALEGEQKPKVLLGISGSVAAVKLCELYQEISKFADVKVVVTKAAMHFVNTLENIEGMRRCIHQDDQEWQSWQEMGDSVLHIDLRNWADCMIIAPLSANTLAKVANGLCDNLLTCVVRAWDYSKPIILAPAMNTLMWSNPFTSHQIECMKRFGAVMVPPVEKKLACGDVGIGAMATPADIAKICRELFTEKQKQRFIGTD